MRNHILVATGVAAVALTAAACGSSSPSGTSGSTSSPSPTSSPSSPGAAQPQVGGGTTTLKSATINGTKVVTNAKGFTLYWFVPDTSTKSNCNGSCAHFWPPVHGPATAGPGVTGTLSTIKRSDGSVQATYRGHPLYTYVGDTAPGQARGNGINLSGGVWHEMTVSGSMAAGGGSSGGTAGY